MVPLLGRQRKIFHWNFIVIQQSTTLLCLIAIVGFFFCILSSMIFNTFMLCVITMEGMIFFLMRSSPNISILQQIQGHKREVRVGWGRLWNYSLANINDQIKDLTFWIVFFYGQSLDYDKHRLFLCNYLTPIGKNSRFTEISYAAYQ